MTTWAATTGVGVRRGTTFDEGDETILVGYLQLFVAVLAYVAVLWGSRLVWGRVGGGVG